MVKIANPIVTNEPNPEELDLRLPFEDGIHPVGVAYIRDDGKLYMKHKRALIKDGKTIKII